VGLASECFWGTGILRRKPHEIPQDVTGQWPYQELERVLRTVGVNGILVVTPHFKMRAAQRGFTTPDALNVLRRGSLVGLPGFCPEFCNWKHVVKGVHDLGALFVVAGVSGGDERQTWSNSVVLITGYLGQAKL
jgi:hypothetical protein